MVSTIGAKIYSIGNNFYEYFDRGKHKHDPEILIATLKVSQTSVHVIMLFFFSI